MTPWREETYHLSRVILPLYSVKSKPWPIPREFGKKMQSPGIQSWNLWPLLILLGWESGPFSPLFCVSVPLMYVPSSPSWGCLHVISITTPHFLSSKALRVTLEANPENLDLRNVEAHFDVDPLFRITCSKFDAVLPCPSGWMRLWRFKGSEQWKLFEQHGFWWAGSLCNSLYFEGYTNQDK